MSRPLTTLLDLDAGRLPALTLRLYGHEIPLRLPESLPLADALHLADLLAQLHDTGPLDDTTPDQSRTFDDTARAIVQLAAPSLADLTPGLHRRIVAFYLDHVATAVQRLSSGGAVPFSKAAMPTTSAPASPPPTDAPSRSNSQ